MSTLEQYIYDKNLWMVGDTPTVINPTGKFPVVANQQWKTLYDLITFVQDVNSSAIPGMIVSVVEDEQPDNNGVYIVEKISDGKNEGSVCKLANIDQIEEIKEQIEKLENDVNITVTDSINTLKQNFKDTVKRLDNDIEESKQYISKAGDDWKTESVGGVSGGLKKDSDILSNKTICDMLDMILYPTLQPIVEPPTITLSLPSTQKKLISVGTILLTESQAFKSTSKSRGSVNYDNANGDRYYAGPVENESLTITDDNRWGQPSEEKKYTIDYSVTFGLGAELLDNKGAKSTVPKYKGGTLNERVVIKSVYPIYINSNGDIKNVNKTYIVDYFDGYTISDVVIPEETDDNKFEIHIPVGVNITSVKQYNPLTKDYTETINMISNGDITYNGIVYNKYVRTKISTDSQGESKYKITFKK